MDGLSPPSPPTEGHRHLPGALPCPSLFQSKGGSFLLNNIQMQNPYRGGLLFWLLLWLLFLLMLITISAVLKPVALIKHASTRGGNWRCSLLAGARLGRLFGGSIFRAGRPDCPLTQICSINTHYSTWWWWWWGGAGGMFIRSGKGALGSKDGKRREKEGKKQEGSSEEEERRGGRAPEGKWGAHATNLPLWLQFWAHPSCIGWRPTEDTSQGRGDTRTTTFLFQASEHHRPGVYAPGPSRTPSPRPPAGLGLTVCAAAAALLARRGGRAIGEGGPVPTPLRGAPAPSPGEAWSWRTALSPPRPGSHAQEETKEGQGRESHPDPVAPPHPSG